MTEVRVLISCIHVWDDEERVVSRLAEFGITVDMPRFSGQQMEEPELLGLIGQYDGILAGDDHLTRRVLESASHLKVISKWGIGVDAIDLDAAAELDIRVFNTPGVFGDELADYAMGFIHLLARHQHEADVMIRQGQWPKIRGVSLAGQTLGIVGLGSSGKALAKRAAAASMTVLGTDVVDTGDIDHCQRVDLYDLLARSDIVSLHVPSTDETRNLINRQTISMMKRGAWLVNTSRGSLVDEEALLWAIGVGQIGAAALDVFATEPLMEGHPVLSLPNVVLGSHNGSNTRQAVARTTERAVQNLLVGLDLQ